MLWSRKYLSLFLAFALTAALLPASAASAFAEEGAATAQASWANTIPDMLACGSYAEGEVLVAMLNQPSAPGRARSASVSLLDGAEDIMGASVGTYEVATGEALPAQQRSALRSSAAAGEDEVVVKLVKQDTTTEELLRTLAQDPRVLFAEPNYSLSFGDVDEDQAKQQAAEVAKSLDDGVATSTEAPLAAPDTSALAGVTKGSFEPAKVNPVDATASTGDLTPYQWGYSNTATTGYATGAPRLEGFDVNLAGWNGTAPNSNPQQVIAVIDSGIDYDHPDLNGVMADMSAYSALGFGKYGVNLVSEDTVYDSKTPRDEYLHGTHVAGIIAAEWNGQGTSGIANGVKLVSIKVGGKNSSSIAAALKGYELLARAMGQGLDLVATNNSYGSSGGSAKMLSIAVAKLGELGAVSAFASGNDGVDVDKLPNIVNGLAHNPYAITVNSSAASGVCSPTSNRGVTATDVFAPGSNIWSTILRSVNIYSPLPQANNAVNESFTTAPDTKITFFGSETPEALDKSIGKHDKDVHFDAAGSWSVPYANMAASSASGGTRCVVLKVPIEKEALGSVRSIGISMLFSGEQPQEGSFTVIPFMEGTSGVVRDPSQDKSFSDKDGWGRFNINLAKMQTVNGEGEKLTYYEEGGNSYLLVGLDIESSVGSANNSRVYFDTIGVGYETSGYGAISGTSMATPVVAGAAAVHAKNLGAAYTNASGSERAKLLAATVKGSVGFTEKFDGLCTSGGQIDLGANVVKTSVINEAAVAGNSGSETLTLAGYFFGAATNDKTAVSVGGKPAAVLSWSDNKIEVICPEGLGRGVHEVKVSNENGKTGRKTFLLNLANEQEGAVPLFEETIALPAQLATTTRSTKMIGRGNKLYLLADCAAASGGDPWFPCYGDMWCFDPASKTWEQLASMPERLHNLSVTLYEGKILVLGVGGTQAPETKLFSFDPDTAAWTVLSGIEAIPQGAAIVNSNGTLMLVGGSSLEKDSIAVFDLASRSVTPVGSLQTPRGVGSPLGSADMQVAAWGTEVFAWGGLDPNKGPVPGKLERMTKTDKGYLSSDISALLPKHAEGYGLDYGFAAVEEGLIAAGVKAALPTDAAALSAIDTYLFDLGKPEAGFASKGLRSSYPFLEMASTYGYGGKLYVAGTNTYEENQFVLRATAMKTLPQPGDIASPVAPDSKPAAGSDVPHKLATTGDSTAPLALVFAMGTLAALVLMAVACRRLKKF